MADLTQLKEWIETYGAGVRAGLVTPCLEDEEAVRKQLGLPSAPQSVKADWKSTQGVRKPVTLQSRGEATEPETNDQETDT